MTKCETCSAGKNATLNNGNNSGNVVKETLFLDTEKVALAHSRAQCMEHFFSFVRTLVCQCSVGRMEGELPLLGCEAF